MDAQQGIGSSPSRRTAFKNLLRLIPAVVIIAATLNTVSCQNNNGLFTQSGGGGGNSPTGTPTAGTGALAFVTNFNDGMVSSFTRNITTGVLKRTGQVTAGAKKGPKGVVAAPSGSFLYVANSADGNIYEFSVSQTNGTLTPLSPPSVSNGKNSGPDEIATSSDGTLMWVTGGNDGTVTTYAVNTSTGQITKNSPQVSGFSHPNGPFGITVDSANSFVYVADHAGGLVHSFSIGTNGKLTQISSVSDLGGSGGSPGFIALDPAGTFIYVTDLGAGVLSVLKTTAGALSFFSTMPTTNTANMPIGIGYAAVSAVPGNFVFTANQGNTTVWSFFLGTPGFPSPPVETPTTGLDAPTGLVVDPQNAFLYVTNQNAGTVSQFALTAACLNAGAPCLVGSPVATESPAKNGSGPFGITLAQ